MSRALVIIMLDFFIMLSIVFFVLQYVQPSDEEVYAAIPSKSNGMISISFDKTPFYEKTGKSSIDLSRLVQFHVTAFAGEDEIPEEDLTVVETFDGIAIAASASTQVSRVVLVPMKIRSIEFAIVGAGVTLEGDGGHAEANFKLPDSTTINGTIY
ncbi:hypothetical protein N1937_00955 [Rhizobium sp. WSM4643]|uniref:hypothetical protein n=1 Tax=Rhizobium sp. WSM4643 TaxID=3138253 RepID=UPI0021A5EC5B|nr:hypothetical protein [Rhizobium leguminosarum]UWM75850.1 hypothetical protein N1937_00955 [Rhizobium leguminosarum bv. viciae]